MMPEDALEALAGHDAIFLGAIGWPTVPDHVSLWGLLLPIRRSFDQYVNLRPARLLRGVRSPLAEPGDLDITVVRENTEGEYSDSGGFTGERRTRSRCRRASSPAAGPSGSSATPSRRRRLGGDFSSGPPTPTASA